MQIKNVKLRMTTEEIANLTPEQVAARDAKKIFRYKHMFRGIVDAFRESKAAKKFIMNEPDPSETLEHFRWSLGCRLANPYMTIFVSSCVLFNSVLMGVYADGHLGTDTFTTLKVIFVCIFSLEISMKLFAYGKDIYFEDSWNILDFVVVSCAIIETILESIESFENDGFSAFLRILGIFRIARIISSLKELEFVVRSFVVAMGSAFWVNILTVLCVYIFAVVGRLVFGEDQGLADATAYHPHGSGANGQELFGSVLRGMATMLQVMTMNWAVPTRIVSEYNSFGWPFFVFSMVFMALGIFNLYTAIYVEKMREISEEKEKKKEAKMKRRRLDLIEEVGDLLNLMDTDRSGTLDREEMKEGMKLLNDTARALPSGEGESLHRALSGSSEFDFSLDHIYLAFEKYMLKNQDEDLQIPYREFLNTVFTMHDQLTRNEVALMHSEIEDRLELNTGHLTRAEEAMDAAVSKLRSALKYTAV